jgi:hypothetical protein
MEVTEAIGLLSALTAGVAGWVLIYFDQHEVDNPFRTTLLLAFFSSIAGMAGVMMWWVLVG